MSRQMVLFAGQITENVDILTNQITVGDRLARCPHGNPTHQGVLLILVIVRDKFHLVGDGVDVDESGVVRRFEFEPEHFRVLADRVDNVHAFVERQDRTVGNSKNLTCTFT